MSASWLMCSVVLCAFPSFVPDGVSWRHACCVIRADRQGRDSSCDKSPGRLAGDRSRRCPGL